VPEDDSVVERQLFAFTEKRQNITVGSASVQTFMMGTSRLDVLPYLLFGANELKLTKTALECDGWIPVVGTPSFLNNMRRLRQLLDACMLRVFEGISKVRREERASRQRRILPSYRPDTPSPLPSRGSGFESEKEYDLEVDVDSRGQALSPIEMQELDLLTRDLVRILDNHRTLSGNLSVCDFR
jgi:hypothetical protein